VVDAVKHKCTFSSVNCLCMIMELQWMSSSHLIQYLLGKFWMATSDLWDLQAYFMQIDGTLNKLTTVECFYLFCHSFSPLDQKVP
jgi:hypothetical protein